MTIIDYRGRKALLITTDELIKMNGNPVYEYATQKLVNEARSHDIIAIMVVTSMIKSGIPKWLREHLDHEIHCYRGFFSGDQALPTEETEGEP